jgi:hypothetical protein
MVSGELCRAQLILLRHSTGDITLPLLYVFGVEGLVYLRYLTVPISDSMIGLVSFYETLLIEGTRSSVSFIRLASASRDWKNFPT